MKIIGESHWCLDSSKNGQYKMQTTDRRLQIGFKMQTGYKMQAGFKMQTEA